MEKLTKFYSDWCMMAIHMIQLILMAICCCIVGLLVSPFAILALFVLSIVWLIDKYAKTSYYKAVKEFFTYCDPRPFVG